MMGALPTDTRLSRTSETPDGTSTSPAENTQRETMQTLQGLDATHGDELFPVKREYIGINSGVRTAFRDGPKNSPSHVETACHF
jgi:hypothetical protein